MNNFHSGERKVQTQAGVFFAPDSPAFPDTLNQHTRTFLEMQRFLIAASLDAEQRPWASILTGSVGFVQAPNDKTISVRPNPSPNDPLISNLAPNAAIGLLFIEPATRRRHRINGHIESHLPSTSGFNISLEQSYGNCPKYIQRRAIEPNQDNKSEIMARITPAMRGSVFSPSQRNWIARADTFFIASSHPDGGADASHRGGTAGFVRVINETRLEFPDYAGNKMFNTLGNISATGRIGLLFLDFEHGHTLQLSGRAEVIWDEATTAIYPGAERVVRFDLETSIETPNAHTLRWYSPEAWSGNPEVPNQPSQFQP
jgi:uncharacterized protein